MNILNMIREKKQQLVKGIDDRRDKAVLKTTALRVAAEDRAKKNAMIADNKRRIREARFGGIKRAAQGIKKNLERNERNSSSPGNVFVQRSGSNPFSGNDSSARNIFTVGSGNNPFDFSNKEKAAVKKNDTITIRIKR
jgi:hypothetical protein